MFSVQEGWVEEWRRVVDTSLHSPDDMVETGEGEPVSSLEVPVQAGSIVVLERRIRKG